MAGTTQNVKRSWLKTAALHLSNAVLDPIFAFYTQINNVVTDLETLRAGIESYVNYKVENLGAGADITERGFFVAPAAITIQDAVRLIPEANSAGVDGSNTLVVTLRNITAGEDIATVTRTTDLALNTAVSLTLTAANADVAAGAVLGIVVTQGAAADAGTFVLQFSFKRQTVDAAADLVASALSDTL